MTLRLLTEPPPEKFGHALETFERQFTYPLGRDRSFRISHGADYLPFFQAIGKAFIHVAEQDGQALGTLARVERRLNLVNSDKSLASIDAHYLCDLKVHPRARGSRVLAKLIHSARRAIEPHPSHACYAMVMDGTGRSPLDYTGRLDVPRFRKLGDILILRLSARDQPPDTPNVCQVNGERFSEIQHQLRRPGIHPTEGRGAARSLMIPLPMTLTNGLACGMLEDTRRGKRLLDAQTGVEMLSAHLSSFHYDSPGDGAALLRAALAFANQRRLPALFAAVPARNAPALLERLKGVAVHPAPATIYGFDLPEGMDWFVDTAEI